MLQRGLFDRARLRLAGWYVVFLGVILLVLDVGVVSIMGSALESRLDDELQQKAAQAAVIVTPPPPPRPFYKKAWFYGVIGGVVAATADWLDEHSTSVKTSAPTGDAAAMRDAPMKAGA